MQFIKDNLAAIIFTLIVHMIVIGLFAVNIDFERKPKPAGPKVAVQAQVVNGAALDAEIKRQEKLEKDKLDAEMKRQQELEDQALQARKKREAEEQRIAELEQQRKEQEAKAQKEVELEKQRKAEAEEKRKAEEDARKKRQADLKKKEEAEKKRLADLEKKRKAEEERLKKLEAEKKKREQEEAERKKKELEARKKAEDDQKRKEEEEKARQAEIAAEEKRLAEEQARLEAEMAAESEYQELLGSGALARYSNAIQQSIERNWRPPATVQPGFKCILNVKQIPGGEVVGMNFGECLDDAAIRLSIEQAVFKASPLPEPEDKRLFERELVITFEPDVG